ncbi:hypothetical protein JKP88DRAFT_283468 [Tribonema minus]|uniref:PH domain-containing protein n=1 Tax=Tribonema minus TaxID=303371 RepID=A0A835YHJ9_9STRA|nr:hypothetical protein JKP88DRAFT_283468 [Tribonema minus]
MTPAAAAPPLPPAASMEAAAPRRSSGHSSRKDHLQSSRIPNKNKNHGISGAWRAEVLSDANDHMNINLPCAHAPNLRLLYIKWHQTTLLRLFEGVEGRCRSAKYQTAWQARQANAPMVEGAIERLQGGAHGFAAVWRLRWAQVVPGELRLYADAEPPLSADVEPVLALPLTRQGTAVEACSEAMAARFGRDCAFTVRSGAAGRSRSVMLAARDALELTRWSAAVRAACAPHGQVLGVSIHRACHDGDLQRVPGASINRACHKGDLQCVPGASIYRACQDGDLQRVQALLGSGRRLPVNAVEAAHPAPLRGLSLAAPAPNACPLAVTSAAAQASHSQRHLRQPAHGKRRCVALRKRTQPSPPTPLTTPLHTHACRPNAHGSTALHYAARRAAQRLVDVARCAGSSSGGGGGTDGGGGEASAAAEGALQLVVYLMARGADARVADGAGRTALDLATRGTAGYPRAQRLLVGVLDSSKYQVEGDALYIVPDEAALEHHMASPAYGMATCLLPPNSSPNLSLTVRPILDLVISGTATRAPPPRPRLEVGGIVFEHARTRPEAALR